MTVIKGILSSLLVSNIFRLTAASTKNNWFRVLATWLSNW